MSTPTSIDELFRSLDLTLTVRASNEEEDGWACTLTRPDGETYVMESVAFFDVDPETGEEWIVEPSPSRVLSVLAGGADVEDEEGDDAGEDAIATAKEFLGEANFALLQQLYDADEE